MDENNVIAAILTAGLWNTRKATFEDWRQIVKDYYRIRQQLKVDASEPSPQMNEDVANRLKELGQMLDVDSKDIK